MFGHIDRRAAILTAQRKALDDPHQDQQDRTDDPGLGVAGQQSDRDRRAAHQQHGGQKRALAAFAVADPPEHQRAQGPKQEAGPEQRQGRRKSRRLGQAGEEGLGDDPGETSEDKEVVPLKGGAGGRGRNDGAQ